MINSIFKKITGTFVDGFSGDIPSNNWGMPEWEREFDVFKATGIDTVFIVRVGWNDSSMYQSEVMKTTLYEEPDLVEIMLNAASRVGIGLYIGLFDSFKHWLVNDWENEIAINRELIHEISERYGKFPAFKGWYISHEGSMHYHQTQIWKPLAEEIKKIDKVRKILVSSRYHGKKCDSRWPVSPEIHGKHFEFILSEMGSLIDAYAFMDGHVGFDELIDYVQVTHEVFSRHGIGFWSNLETFDRDMLWKFPPIEWMKLRHKLEIVQPYVEKIITFESPHFLSPNSMFPSAGNLYQRYMDYIQKYK